MAQIIRYLPEHLINQIAAGEVVERPAAVVRELVENALDAGATKIDVVVRDGGMAELAVHDNGCGMSLADLTAAVDRHATSKLPTDNIFAIQTMGFRGEALAAIGAVSKLTITSKRAHNSHGWQLEVFGGRKSQPTPAPAPQGTSVVVQELFFATPARLKFMKSAMGELRAIRQVLSRLALTYPHISFTLYDGERQILAALAVDNLAARWAQIWRPDVVSKATVLQQSLNNTIGLEAVLTTPTDHQPNSEHIIFLINQRPVQDRNLLQAVRVAYGDTIPRGRYPAALIKLTLPPDDVDMNVHPAKAEVRLRDVTTLKSLLINALKAAVQQPFSLQHTAAIGGGSTPNYYTPTAQALVATATPALAELPTHYRTHADIEHLPVADNLPTTIWQPLVQLFDTYIVALSDQGLVLIDQHAAHERIVYEQLKNTLAAQQTMPAQHLLLPEIVTLDIIACAALLSVAEPLNALGLVVESFGSNAVAVQATPALLGANINVAQLVHDLAELAQTDNAQDFLEKQLHNIAAKMACYGSVRAGRRLTMADMQSLLAQIAATNASGQCNHGRPTIRLLTEKDLSRLFERG